MPPPDIEHDSPGKLDSPLLCVRNLAIARNGVTLARGIDLELRSGELTAVIGPSGCGKSTLLLGICGLIDPAGGEIRLEGREPHEWGYPAFRRLVVYVPQKPALLETTVKANLERVFSYRTAGDETFQPEEAEILMDRFRIPRLYMRKQAMELSVGEQQRICLIRSIMVRPRVLLLDEPTSALDPAGRDQVEQTLIELSRERGLAGLVVTHDHAQASRLCSRTLDLAQHQTEQTLAAEGTR